MVTSTFDLENPNQLPVKEVFAGILIIVSRYYHNFSFIHIIHVFRVKESICWHFYRATMFDWLRKSRSISGSTGTRRYGWLCLIDFHSVFTIYVSRSRNPFLAFLNWATVMEWPRKSKSTSGSWSTFSTFEYFVYRKLSINVKNGFLTFQKHNDCHKFKCLCWPNQQNRPSFGRKF